MSEFVIQSRYNVGDMVWFYDRYSYGTRYVQGEIVGIAVKGGRLVYKIKQVHEEEWFESDLRTEDPLKGVR